jgi:hypothetical protein
MICVDDVPNDNLTNQINNIEVYEKADENTTYKMNFMVDVCDGDIGKSIESATAPGKILSILAKVKDEFVCLVKGPVTQQEAHMQHGGSGSWMHVEGEDTGHTMDRATDFRVTDSASDADIATQVIQSNGQMIPDVESTPGSMHDENNHSHVQRETNLALLRTLARRNGFHFWITYDATGMATGHFRSRSLDGSPAATLIVNQENYNIDSLRVSADTRAPSQTVGRQLDLRNKSDIDGSNTLTDTTLGNESLATLSGSQTQSTHFAPVVDDAGAMRSRGTGALREAQWFIHATCRTSLHRLCQIVRFHTVIEIVGAGSRHSGKYYVTGVKHSINSVSYAMELELARNAWGN